ncbi:L,D-transpeptidase [Streptomyces sp. NPDC101152]|uniref:L,D-transpeptidase n=1 Tax=Streptomyces sp. NPDC101152 TaxID=3366116 RepID=UPI00382B6036
MSDDLDTGLRELARSAERLPPVPGAGIRHLAERRRRRRRRGAIAALGGTAAVAAVALALVLSPGGAGPERQQEAPAARPTSARSAQPAPDVRVDLSTRELVVVADGRGMPVSSGGANTPTPTGRLTVVSRTPAALVSGAEVGRPRDHRYKVLWVIRLRAGDGRTTALFGMTTDETAPGAFDVTSGWIGLRTADAKWLYDRLRTGSVITVQGHAPAAAVGGGPFA